LLGGGEAVYEVTQQNPATIDTFAVPVYLSGTASVPAGSAINATAQLAPTGATGNIPNFSGTSGALTVASAVACVPLGSAPGPISAAEQGVPFAITMNGQQNTRPETFYISNPVKPPPAITSINPSSAATGSSSAPLNVAGENFAAGSTISWTAPNGFQTSITPSLLQAAQIAATVPAALLTTPGTAQVAIASPSGVLSNTAAFTISAPNWITSVSPSSAPAGAAAAQLTLAGPFFSGTPTVTWVSPGGQAIVLTPSQILPQQITVSVPGTLLQTPGFAQVGVTGSNQLRFTINTGTGIVNPSTVLHGSTDTPITVTGASLFGSGSTIRWTRPDGKTTTITPRLVQDAQIAAIVPAALLTTPGTAQVAIADPSGILSSPSLPFTISSPLSITGLTPNSQTAGSTNTLITVTGAAALTSGTTVTWTDPNGQVTNLGGMITAAQIAATVSASLLSSPGTAQVGLVDGSGVLSNQLPFNVTPFNISSVNPNSATWGALRHRSRSLGLIYLAQPAWSGRHPRDRSVNFRQI
jgi:hypothetical protein